MANFKRPNKLFLAISAIVVVGLIAVANISPVFSQQGTLFSDMFYMNAYDWTAVTGNWEVQNGEYTETEDPGSETAWATAGAISWTDYAVEAQFRSTDKDGKLYLAGRWVDEDNHYAMEYSTTDAGASSAKVILYKIFNGGRVDLLTITSNVPYVGQGASNPVNFKLYFNGSTIKLFKKEATDTDWVLMGTTADTSLTYGKVALGEFNRVPYFDNIMVWDITPPEITNVAQADVTGSTYSVTFTTSELASPRVDYGLSVGSYTLYKEKTTRATSHRIDLTGLNPSTTYHFKISATDAGGNTTSTGNLTFTTTGTVDVTAPTISSVVYNEVYANTATIKWSTNEAANSTVEYGTATGSFSYSVSHSDYVTSHSVTISGLKGSTNYFFRVKSRDVTGNTAVSQEYKLTTLKDLKPKITGVKAGSTPSVYVSVYWQGIPVADFYKIYFSTSNNWGTVAKVVYETGAASYVYTKLSLTNYINYFIKIVAVDGTETGVSEARAYPPDSNPHGYYSDNPGLCGNCHYTHKAMGPSLVAATTANNLCVTCHDGTQSKYDVLSGKYRGPGSVGNDVYRGTWYNSIAGPYGTIGGKTVANSAYQPTSRHDLDIYNYSAPGNNIENLEVADAHLSCASCHDPHGSENYRLLRADMRCSVDPTAPLLDIDAYTVTGATYESTIYVQGAVDFCGSCHSDFNQGAGAGSTAARTTDQAGFDLSAASTDMYMHAVNVNAQFTTETGVHITPPTNLPYENGKVICQTCHFTHGTINTGDHVRRDGVPSTVLKRFDQTVGCEACHNKTDYPE